MFSIKNILYVQTIGTQSMRVLTKKQKLRRNSSMKLVPLNDRVVLKHLVAEETTKSGIVLTGNSKEKP